MTFVKLLSEIAKPVDIAFAYRLPTAVINCEIIIEVYTCINISLDMHDNLS